jgi:hypothetical protein
MKNYNDTIGNRSRDLPVCSAVPRTLRHQQRATLHRGYLVEIKEKGGRDTSFWQLELWIRANCCAQSAWNSLR